MKILDCVRKDLKDAVDIDYLKGSGRFFKEEFVSYGVKTPVVRKIAKKYFQQLKSLDKRQIFSLSEEFLKSGYNEESTIAIQWVGELREEYTKNDFNTFSQWLNLYIDNWAKDDDFCLHVIHPMIDKYPDLIAKTKRWTNSKNLWVRRAAAVSFITTSGSFYATKHGLDDIFAVAEMLLKDKEDLVQKGYGWMLKAASIHHQKEVFAFVIKNRLDMPRTALRYAIEKMPKELKMQAMKK